MEKADIRALVADTWRQEGLTGRAGRWRFTGPDVQWLVAIEGNWLGRIGVVMDAAVGSPGQPPEPEDDYPLRMFAENLHSIDGTEFLHALNPAIDIEDVLRAAILRDSARGIAAYVLQHGTFDALRASYRAGELDSHAIRKDLRERFESQT